MRIYLPCTRENSSWNLFSSNRGYRDVDAYQIGYAGNGEVEFVTIYNVETRIRDRFEAEVIQDDKITGVKIIKCGDFTFIYENGLITSFPVFFGGFNESPNSEFSSANNVTIKYDMKKNFYTIVDTGAKEFYYFGKSAESKYAEIVKNLPALAEEKQPDFILETNLGSNFKTNYNMFSLDNDLHTWISIQPPDKRYAKTVRITYLSEKDTQCYDVFNEKDSKMLSHSQAILKLIDGYHVYCYTRKSGDRDTHCCFDVIDEFGYKVYCRSYFIVGTGLISAGYIDESADEERPASVMPGRIACCCDSYACFDIVDGKMKRVDIPSSSKISREFNYDF